MLQTVLFPCFIQNEFKQNFSTWIGGFSFQRVLLHSEMKTAVRFFLFLSYCIWGMQVASFSWHALASDSSASIHFPPASAFHETRTGRDKIFGFPATEQAGVTAIDDDNEEEDVNKRLALWVNRFVFVEDLTPSNEWLLCTGTEQDPFLFHKTIPVYLAQRVLRI